jgi:3-dehydroquinate synthase
MKNIHCNNYAISINDWPSFNLFLSKLIPTKVFVLVDENTEKYCLPIFLEHIDSPIHVIRVSAGETNKNIETCQYIWSSLLSQGADRLALLINLGGGVIGDMGGFCAATYMRGMPFVQMPTTLLSQVDASIGGKLGVDFKGYKNMIGLIQDPSAVFIFTKFLDTLPDQDIRSGYAELLKHGLIADKITWQNLSVVKDIRNLDFEQLVYDSVVIKKTVTEKDPHEKGLRKILNFGHTVGHAIESHWMDSRTPLLHGEAIAIGMICEAFISYRIGKITELALFEIRNAIIQLFGHHPKFVKPSEAIISKMRSDKKNLSGEFRFVLLDDIGNACFDIPIVQGAIDDSLLFYKEKIG